MTISCRPVRMAAHGPPRDDRPDDMPRRLGQRRLRGIDRTLEKLGLGRARTDDQHVDAQRRPTRPAAIR